MTSGRILWIVEDRYLRAFLQAPRSPAGFAVIGLLIEGNEFILNDGHAPSKIRRMFAADAVIGDNCRRGERIANERSLAAMLHDHRDCERCSESSVEGAVRFPIEVARDDQHREACRKEDDGAQPRAWPRPKQIRTGELV